MTNPVRLLRPKGQFTTAVWFACAVLLFTTGWLATETHRRVESLAREQSAIMRFQSIEKRPIPPALSQEDRELDKRLAALRVERDFRWYPLFRALERASSEDIELLEFAPDKVNRTFVLRGEARDMQALLAYVASLSTQEDFSGVYLTHQKAGQRGSLAIHTFEVRGRIR